MFVSSVREVCEKARGAFLSLAVVEAGVRDAALDTMAEAIERRAGEILRANREDCKEAEAAVRSGELTQALLKRLGLDEAKVAAMAENVRAVRRQPDPIGRSDYACRLDEGLVLRRVTCPLGVVAAVFEARPDALPQIASLCLKSANAVILKGGKEAILTNRVTARLLADAAESRGIPPCALQLLEAREEVKELLGVEGLVDLIVPRGSNDFIRYIRRNTRTPVLGHADGICHLYVDRTADVKMAVELAVDAKTNYPAACNTIETLLVHEGVAAEVLPAVVRALREAGVEVRGCEKTRSVVSDALPASEEDWDTEYLDLILSIRIVPDLAEAIGHVNRHGSKHTDAIVTEDPAAAQAFLEGVDSASVLWNASTRFADGYRYGLGAEVGISTEKVHARGPVGLEGLVTYKYQVVGAGQRVADYMGKDARPFLHQPLPTDVDLFSHEVRNPD
ncbi:MAG: glutamate-5-semialdehyde dehydrogenase [Nitrospinota bacterium]